MCVQGAEMPAFFKSDWQPFFLDAKILKSEGIQAPCRVKVQFRTPTRARAGRSGGPRGRYGLRNSHSTV